MQSTTMATISRHFSDDDTATGGSDQQPGDQQETNWQRLKRLSAMSTHQLGSKRLGVQFQPGAQQLLHQQQADILTSHQQCQQQQHMEMLNIEPASCGQRQLAPSAHSPGGVHGRPKMPAAGDPGDLKLSIVGSHLKSALSSVPQAASGQAAGACPTQEAGPHPSSVSASQRADTAVLLDPAARGVPGKGASPHTSSQGVQASPNRRRAHASVRASITGLVASTMPLPMHQLTLGFGEDLLQHSDQQLQQQLHQERRQQQHHPPSPAGGGSSPLRLSWQAASAQVPGEERLARYAAELSELDIQLQLHASHSKHLAAINASGKVSPRPAAAAASDTVRARPDQGVKPPARRALDFLRDSATSASAMVAFDTAHPAGLPSTDSLTSTLTAAHPLLVSMWAEQPALTGAAVTAAASTSTLQMEAEAMLARVQAAVGGPHKQSMASASSKTAVPDQGNNTTSSPDASGDALCHHAASRQHPRTSRAASQRTAAGAGAKAAAIRQGVASAFSGLVEDLVQGGGSDIEAGLEATVRRIMEGAQLQILELQYQQRQAELEEEQQSQQEQQEQQPYSSNSRDVACGGRHAHPHQHQQLSAGSDSTQQQCVAAAIPLWASVRCRLLLRRWWRAVRGQRQWARKVIVFMAAARLRRLLHAWRQAAYQERQEGVKQAQATQSEGRMEQVADRFRRAWLLHIMLAQWRMHTQSSAQERAQQQEAAAAVAAEAQAEHHKLLVATRYRAAYMQHAVLRVWRAEAKAARLAHQADADASRRRTVIASFLTKVAGKAGLDPSALVPSQTHTSSTVHDSQQCMGAAASLPQQRGGEQGVKEHMLPEAAPDTRHGAEQQPSSRGEHGSVLQQHQHNILRALGPKAGLAAGLLKSSQAGTNRGSNTAGSRSGHVPPGTAGAGASNPQGSARGTGPSGRAAAAGRESTRVSSKSGVLATDARAAQKRQQVLARATGTAHLVPGLGPGPADPSEALRLQLAALAARLPEGSMLREELLQVDNPGDAMHLLKVVREQLLAQQQQQQREVVTTTHWQSTANERPGQSVPGQGQEAVALQFGPAYVKPAAPQADQARQEEHQQQQGIKIQPDHAQVEHIDSHSAEHQCVKGSTDHQGQQGSFSYKSVPDCQPASVSVSHDLPHNPGQQCAGGASGVDLSTSQANDVPIQEDLLLHEQGPQATAIPEVQAAGAADWVSADSWDSRGSRSNPESSRGQSDHHQQEEGADERQQQRVSSLGGTGSRASDSVREHHTAGRTAITPRHKALPSCRTSADLQAHEQLPGSCGRPGTSHSSRSAGSSAGSVASCQPGPPLQRSLLDRLTSTGGGSVTARRPGKAAAAAAAAAAIPSPRHATQHRRNTGASSAGSCAGSIASGSSSLLAGGSQRHPSSGRRRPSGSSTSGSLAESAAGGNEVAERLLAQARAAEARRQRSAREQVAAVSGALMSEATELADLHYQRSLLLRWGLRPLLKLVADLHLKEHRAALHCIRRRVRSAWAAWRRTVAQRHWQKASQCAAGMGALMLKRKAAVKAAALKALWRWWAANRMARWRLLATALSAIRTYVVWGRLAKRDARLHRRAHVLKHTLTTWRKNAQMEAHRKLLSELEHMHKAEVHHSQRLCAMVLVAWRQAAQEAQADREAEARRAETWSRIGGWLSELRPQQPPAAASSLPAAAAVSSSPGQGKEAGGTVSAECTHLPEPAVSCQQGEGTTVSQVPVITYGSHSKDAALDSQDVSAAASSSLPGSSTQAWAAPLLVGPLLPPLDDGRPLLPPVPLRPASLRPPAALASASQQPARDLQPIRMDNTSKGRGSADITAAGNLKDLAWPHGPAPRQAAPARAEYVGHLNRSERLRHFVTVQMVKSGEA